MAKNTRFYSVYACPRPGTKRWTRLSPIGLPLDIARHVWASKLTASIAIRPTGQSATGPVRPLTATGYSRLGVAA